MSHQTNHHNPQGEPMTTQPTQPLHDLDTLVSRYLDLKDESEQIASQIEHVKEQLRTLGVGSHTTASGVTVTIQAPARTFDATAAWALLTAEQKALCTKPDPAKVKSQLPGVVVESLMKPGTGAPVVKVG